MKKSSQSVGIKKLSDKIKVATKKLNDMKEELKEMKQDFKNESLVVAPVSHKKAAKKKVGRKKKWSI